MNDKDRLFRWMDENDISVARLAEAIGVTRQLISMIRTGEREISGKFKWKFSQAFGNDAAKLIFLDESRIAVALETA